ncbi:hypothetical protein ACIRQP_10650 [Streptomyces sp. NPDC102274]|uniref:hypothetical protein n=1 Tax=Streptomyces sp. NPDC102274 TaxID=3366151 RepID=UPI0037FAEAFB
MPEFHRSGGEDPLSAALKHAADQSGRRVVPLPVEEIEARGTRRRRTVLALAAACAVCVLSGASAVAALNLTSEQPPARPVPSVTPSRFSSPPSPLPTTGQFSSPSGATTSAEASTGSPGGGVPSGSASYSPAPPASGSPSGASPFTTPTFGQGGLGPSVTVSPSRGTD